MSDDLLLEDYKLKLDYVRGQYDRLWQRFNFFLTVELALFGFLGYLTFDAKVIEATILPGSIGLVISILWYIVGAQDRRLVEVYRKRANDAAVRIAAAPGSRLDFAEDHAAADIPSGWRAVRSWYWSWLSMTRLPATFGLLLTVIWVLVLVWWRPLAKGLSLSPP